MIGLIDTGISNLGSVKRWLNTTGIDFCTIVSSNDFDKVDLIIFPGVGSYGSVVKYLVQNDLKEPLKNYILSGGKFIGICLGFQILFSSSDEGIEDGLGIFKEKISTLNKNKDVILPHVGFNEISISSIHSTIFKFDSKSFYFTHSYGLIEYDDSINNYIIGKTEYQGIEIISYIESDNVIAFQFHPEKSSSLGILLLTCIIEWSKKD